MRVFDAVAPVVFTPALASNPPFSPKLHQPLAHLAHKWLKCFKPSAPDFLLPLLVADRMVVAPKSRDDRGWPFLVTFIVTASVFRTILLIQLFVGHNPSNNLANRRRSLRPLRTTRLIALRGVPADSAYMPPGEPAGLRKAV